MKTVLIQGVGWLNEELLVERYRAGLPVEVLAEQEIDEGDIEEGWITKDGRKIFIAGQPGEQAFSREHEVLASHGWQPQSGNYRQLYTHPDHPGHTITKQGSGWLHTMPIGTPGHEQLHTSDRYGRETLINPMEGGHGAKSLAAHLDAFHAKK